MYAELMEFWGGEFLDDGMFGSAAPLEPPKLILPIELLELFLDKDRQSFITNNEAQYVFHLTELIRKQGLLEPLEIVYSSTAVALKEGNHRYLALKALGYTEIPCRIRPAAGRMRTKGLSLEKLLEWVVNAYDKG